MNPAHARSRRSRWFLPALCVGWALIAVGAVFAFTNSTDSKPFTLIAYVVAFDVIHDAIIAPLVIIGGWLIGRFVPSFARGPVRAATALTVLVIAFAAPLIGAFGRRPTNSSTLPLAYTRNTLIVIAVIWATALLIMIRRRRARPTTEQAGPALTT